MPDANETNDLVSEMARRALDAAYVAVGLGVLGLQRVRVAQHDLVRVARHDLVRQDRVDGRVARVRTGVATGTQQIGEWLEGTISLVTSQLAPLGAQLPEPARELAGKARARLEEVGTQLRHLATPGD